MKSVMESSSDGRSADGSPPISRVGMVPRQIILVHATSGVERMFDDPERSKSLLHCDHITRPAEHGVTECLVLNAQRLALGEGVAGDVALGHPSEHRHRLPLQRD